MKFTYYGHSSFQVELMGKKLLFDPFISPNPLASAINVDQIEADYIFLSHAHEDHIADAVAIAKRTGATCVAPAEVSYWLGAQGVSNVIGMNPGGFITREFGKFKGTVAIHSSSFPDGSYGGNPIGFLFHTDEVNFYYSGDTALTADMQLIPLWGKLDVAVFPIGGHFTMDVDDAIHAANFCNCEAVVGVHYDTFPPIALDKQKATEAFKAAGKTLHLPRIGETVSF